MTLTPTNQFIALTDFVKLKKKTALPFTDK